MLASVVLAAIFFSCKKTEVTTISPVETQYSEATYKMEITGKWKAPEFTVPPSVHFTYFTGMVHNKETYFWKEGTLASPGVEYIAEDGNPIQMFREIDSITALKKATALFYIPPPASVGTSSGNIYCNSNFSYVSCESMIAPSPDWFVGLSSFNLYGNNKWIQDTTINLYVYDAGTEEGDVFGYGNPETNPRQPVIKLTAAKATVLANGNTSLAAIASIRFIKQ